MNYHNVKFAAAYGTSKQLPPSKRAEVSFVGRSNVGKSSLMNKLFNRKKLAKVSATPGKTSTINFFEAEWADFVDCRAMASRKFRSQKKPDGAK